MEEFTQEELMRIRDTGKFTYHIHLPYSESRFEGLTGHKFSKTKEVVYNEKTEYYYYINSIMRCTKCGASFLHCYDSSIYIYTMTNGHEGEEVLRSFEGKMIIFPDRLLTCKEHEIADILD